MDSARVPAFHTNPPTSSSDPDQQRAPHVPSTSGTKDMNAPDTVPTSADGTEGAKPGRTDGPKNPDPPSSGSGEGTAGTEYNSHMKGTAAPGSHSELFGLTPNEGRVHPPPGSGAGGGVIGTSGHRETHNNTAAGGGASAGVGGDEGGARGDEARGNKPNLISRLNPLTDADQDGRKGVSD